MERKGTDQARAALKVSRSHSAMNSQHVVRDALLPTLYMHSEGSDLDYQLNRSPTDHQLVAESPSTQAQIPHSQIHNHRPMNTSDVLHPLLVPMQAQFSGQHAWAQPVTRRSSLSQTKLKPDYCHPLNAEFTCNHECHQLQKQSRSSLLQGPYQQHLVALGMSTQPHRRAT